MKIVLGLLRSVFCSGSAKSLHRIGFSCSVQRLGPETGACCMQTPRFVFNWGDVLALRIYWTEMIFSRVS